MQIMTKIYIDVNIDQRQKAKSRPQDAYNAHFAPLTQDGGFCQYNVATYYMG